MENHNSHIAEFISLFNQTARYYCLYTVAQNFALEKSSYKQTEVRDDE